MNQTARVAPTAGGAVPPQPGNALTGLAVDLDDRFRTALGDLVDVDHRDQGQTAAFGIGDEARPRLSRPLVSTVAAEYRDDSPAQTGNTWLYGD